MRLRTLSSVSLAKQPGRTIQHFRGERGERFGAAELGDAADDADPGDGILAEYAEVVENDDRPVGPADQHRLLQHQLAQHRGDVLGPERGVGVARGGLVGPTVPAEVQRHQPVVVGQGGAHLALPREPGLREAVEEHQRASAGVAGFDDVQPGAAASRDHVVFDSRNDPRRVLDEHLDLLSTGGMTNVIGDGG